MLAEVTGSGMAGVSLFFRDILLDVKEELINAKQRIIVSRATI